LTILTRHSPGMLCRYNSPDFLWDFLSFWDIVCPNLSLNPRLSLLKMDECEPGETAESCAQRRILANVDIPEQCRAGQPATGMACNRQASTPPPPLLFFFR
jgi:hypothetical protein